MTDASLRAPTPLEEGLRRYAPPRGKPRVALLDLALALLMSDVFAGRPRRR